MTSMSGPASDSRLDSASNRSFMAQRTVPITPQHRAKPIPSILKVADALRSFLQLANLIKASL
jgi:hypothetical protein